MPEIKSIDDIVALAKSGYTDWSEQGFVSVRQRDNLLIFNYNAMAQYEANWTFFERVSRGLIINHETGEIVARAFDKFFGWGEGNRTSDADIISITEKIDGSLGILYRYKNDYHIATRGSFDGKQAVWATQYLQQHYDLTGLDEVYTLIFEIIYPENRVVVDYEEREDLVLLAVRNRFTGEFLPFDMVQEIGSRYRFSLPKVYQFEDVDSLISHAHQLGSDVEGYVVEFADGQRFKFKSLEYLKLHKLIVSLKFKNILEAMQSNTIDRILETAPDEFLDETRSWISEIEETIRQIKQEVQAVFDEAPKATRKEFAMWVREQHLPISRYLFAMMDDRDITSLIYQRHEWGHDEEESLE